MPAVRAQPDPSCDYRRRARRLRSILHRQPARLHRSLRHLADEIDHRQDEPQRVRPVGSVRASHFESIVQNALTTGPLRYSKRIALLKSAEALGLGRFEANLILAIEQNKVHPVSLDTPTRSWFPAAAILIAGVVQTGLIAAVWWVMST
jgi:hypothetical protein